MKSEENRSAAVIIVRELLRTPAFRELLKTNLAAATEEDAGALAHALIWEDVDVSLGAASRLSLVVNSLTRVLGELNGLLEQASPRVRRAFFARLAHEVDGEALKEQGVRLLENLHVLLWDDEEMRAGVGRWLAGVANHGLEQLARVHQQDPTRLAEPLRAVVGEVLPRLDYGLVREGVSAMADSAARVLPGAVERVAGDAVLLANLLSSLPPVLNSLLTLGGRAVAAADLPPEVLASALFNLLQKVDTVPLAELVNQLCARLLALHQGSMVLGRHEPRLQAVLTRLGQDLLSRLDQQQLTRVAVALGEDAGTLARAGSDLLLRDPELLPTLAAAYLGAVRQATRGAADALGALGRLPGADLDRLLEQLEAAEPQCAARLVNEAAALTWQVLERDPRRADRILERTLDTLDAATLGRLAVRLLGPVVRREVDALTPQQVGRAMGAALSWAGQTLERDPSLIRDAVERALADADPARTRDLVDSALGQVKEALGHRPELVKALVQPLVAALGGLLWEYMRTLGQQKSEEEEPDSPPRDGLRRRLWRRLRNKEEKRW